MGNGIGSKGSLTINQMLGSILNLASTSRSLNSSV